MTVIGPKEAISAAVDELDRALQLHEQWAEDIYAALVCHLEPDSRDIRPDAYRHCRFGQWYYGAGSSVLRQHRGFAEVETEHKRMHELAADLLRASARHEPIAPRDHQRFVAAMKRTRLEIQALKRELEVSLYNIDPLTGVPGRVEMLHALREQQDYVSRSVHGCAVAMLDVDRFKSVNDSYGHPVGDGVLVAICRYMQTHLRAYDMIFRYGGEEFLLCLPETDPDGAFRICDRLRLGLSRLRHAAGDGTPIKVTASVGIAALDPDLSVEEAIDRADRALLAAKASGRNRALVWQDMMAAA